MNKLLIPTMLVATVLVAGIFALVPIEQASTVHTTIQGTQLEFKSDTSAASKGAGVDYTLTCDRGCILEAIYIDDDDAVDTQDNVFTTITITNIIGVETSTIDFADEILDPGNSNNPVALTDELELPMLLPAGSTLTITNTGTSTDHNGLAVGQAEAGGTFVFT